LKDCKTALGSLGAKRETPEEQRRYLLDVAMHFQRITTLALDVKYGSDDIFDQDSKLRLPTTVQNRSETFSNDIELKGHTFQFHHKPPNPTPGVRVGTRTRSNIHKINRLRGREEDLKGTPDYIQYSAGIHRLVPLTISVNL